MKPREPGSIFAALDRSLDEIGDSAGTPTRGAELAADFLGKTKWTILHEIDPEDPKHRMSVRTLSLLAQRFKLHALAHYFAACAEGVFIPLKAANDPRWDRLTAQAFEDMGRLGAEFFRDLSDGKIDAGEARRLLPLVDEMQRHFAAMNGMLRAVIEEGGK